MLDSKAFCQKNRYLLNLFNIQVIPEIKQQENEQTQNQQSIIPISSKLAI